MQGLLLLKVTDPQDEAALADGLRQCRTLREIRFSMFDTPPLWLCTAIAACPHIQHVIFCCNRATEESILALARSPTLQYLKLRNASQESWLLLNEEIRQGRCHIKNLILTRASMELSRESLNLDDVTNNLKIMASTIAQNRTVELILLYPPKPKGVTNEGGVAFAEALQVNTTLRKLTLVGTTVDKIFDKDAYKAFAEMLQVNRGIELMLPPPVNGADEETQTQYGRMCIEHWLNKDSGLGDLLDSNQTTRDDWVDALRKLKCAGHSTALQTGGLLEVCRVVDTGND